MNIFAKILGWSESKDQLVKILNKNHARKKISWGYFTNQVMQLEDGGVKEIKQEIQSIKAIVIGR